ncbi:MAG TPA: ATP-binding protein [Kofleriaceae bacterium]|nr:ATP-binding protein [Kofleriaceae bacterium]
MKVAPRITMATAAVAALASGLYAYVDLRSRATDRRRELEGEALSVALAVRGSLESAGPAALRNAPATLARDLAKSRGWRVTIVPRQLTGVGEAPGVTAAQLVRMRSQLESPRPVLFEEDDDLVLDLPLRMPDAATAGALTPAGMIEVGHSQDDLRDATTDDRNRALLLVGLVVAVTTLAAGLLARSLVTRPIAKLLGGIDDVAKGDLSHVILSERDDEIGRIATRFNEMTFSLRESRGESARQNTQKLELEQRLSHTEKLATIGQLAAEIAHEVGTPLGVIAGRARSIQKKSGDRETVEKNAQIVAEQTARITRIIQRLLDFARRKAGAPERIAVQLNEVTLSTMELLGGQFANARIRTTLARAEGLPRIAGDADRLQQVLLNLLLNAIQAMPDGGTLRVETFARTRRRPGLELAPEQSYVCVEVTDSGVGIPEDKRDKIFEPFYTTKEGQGGTGLGLAVCSGIVKEHDGWIEIDDPKPIGPESDGLRHGTGRAGNAGSGGSGTVFRIFLPAAPETEGSRARSGTEPPPNTARFNRA